MNKIELVEGTYFRRRFHQPQPPPHKCKELVNCLFCDTSSYPDDEEHATERVGRTKRCKGVLRLDKLMSHIKDKHPECIPAEGRSLLDMGFTTTRTDNYSTDRRNRPIVNFTSKVINRLGKMVSKLSFMKKVNK